MPRGDLPVEHDAIAVLSDIHGNVRALDAVLEDIERRGIHRIVNLGDCLYGPFDPRPVADRLLRLAMPTVSGNEDRVLVFPDRTAPAAGRPLSRTARFTRAQLDRRHLDWLASLPLTAVVGDAFVFHGAPRDDETYLLSVVLEGRLALRTGVEIDALVGDVPQTLVFCGHDHTPRLVRRERRVIVNPGSVGCPAYDDDVPGVHVVENGSPDARLAIVRSQGGAPPSVEFAAVPYDAAGAAAEARANGFPDWATWIASGRTS
jgi:diadenosine tetraphosphatase ApaH/serine/threonine PP2A family protein phosphatase